MLNRSASLAMSTSVLKTLPGKLYIKRHSPSILYVKEDEEGNQRAPSGVTKTLDSANAIAGRMARPVEPFVF